MSSFISFVQLYVPFLKKNAIQDKQATPEELSKEREELKKIALAENNKVKHKILEQICKRAEPSIQRNIRFLEHYQLPNREDVRQALIGSEYQRMFEDSFEAENDTDHSQILSFFNVEDTQKSELTKNPTHVYATIFAQFEDKNEKSEHYVAHSHPSILPCRKFCREQLDKIGLGLNDGPSIASSTYAICIALYNFRHTNKAMAYTPGYKNAHQEVAQAAFTCVNQSSFKDFVCSQLIVLGVDKEILKKAGFDLAH